MRLFAIAIALCAIGMTGSYAAHRPDTSDAVLADRVSGTPQKCIPRNDISHHHLYSDGRILYSTRGQNPDFLNKTGPGCGGVNPNSSIFYLAYSNPLIAKTSFCQGDRIRLVSKTGFVGSCTLGSFVPYPKLKRGHP
jgi:hypothetical protein